MLVTDEHHAYWGLGKIYQRETVNHSDKKYVNKNGFSTNGIENYWSLLKRGIYGIYHQISEKHTQAYLDEFSFRFNSREEEVEDRFVLALKQNNSRLTYSDLIGKV